MLVLEGDFHPETGVAFTVIYSTYLTSVLSQCSTSVFLQWSTSASPLCSPDLTFYCTPLFSEGNTSSSYLGTLRVLFLLKFSSSVVLCILNAGRLLVHYCHF